MSIHKDIKELIEDKLTAKQLERYHAMSGHWTERVRSITRAKWAQDAITEIERRNEERIEQEYKEYDTFAKKVEGKYFKAQVKYFDKSRGWGKVNIPELGMTLDLFSCNIKGRKTWYSETACVFYYKNQIVDVSLKVHGPEQPMFVNGETPGHLDIDKWNSLDHDRLAFKCNEEGDTINGLFR